MFTLFSIIIIRHSGHAKRVIEHHIKKRICFFFCLFFLSLIQWRNIHRRKDFHNQISHGSKIIILNSFDNDHFVGTFDFAIVSFQKISQDVFQIPFFYPFLRKKEKFTLVTQIRWTLWFIVIKHKKTKQNKKKLYVTWNHHKGHNFIVIRNILIKKLKKKIVLL